MSYGFHFGHPGFHHFVGEPSMHEHPCRMGPMSGRRGWRHRKFMGPCGDRSFERGIPIDITEEADSIQILADVPGASKESIQIEVDRGVLSINVLSPEDPASVEPSAPPHPPPNEANPTDGQPSAPAPADAAATGPGGDQEQTLQAEEGGAAASEAPKRRFIVQQRPTKFAKRFVPLPEGADALKAEASCTNGVLTITIPREEVPDSKKRVPVA